MQRQCVDVWWRLRRRAGALALLLPVLIAGTTAPVGAESFHWGEAAVRLGMRSYSGINTAFDGPGSSSWSVSTVASYAAVWHRVPEVTVGTSLQVSGSMSSNRENTLGALGTATLSLSAPPSATSRGFTAVVTGEYRRTQTLFQLELQGTASDSTGEAVAVRVTGSGTWVPTAGDGALSRITAAEVPMQLTLIFPGEVPPPPGPKAASTIAFGGTASLPAFPCPPPIPGQNPCVGTFSGTQDSAFAGDNAAGLWALNTTSPLSITFSYADLIQPGVPCVEGTAAGAVTVNNDEGSVLGFWTNRVDIPVLIKSAEVTFRFNWTRIGSAAVLSISDISLWIHVQGPKGWIHVIEPDSSAATAAAAFLPDMTQAHLTACQEGRTGPPITAEVEGVATIEGI